MVVASGRDYDGVPHDQLKEVAMPYPVSYTHLIVIGRGAFLTRRSSTGRSCGVLRPKNAGKSSENKVRILVAEYPRSPG